MINLLKTHSQKFKELYFTDSVKNLHIQCCYVYSELNIQFHNDIIFHLCTAQTLKNTDFLNSRFQIDGITSKERKKERKKT